MQKNLNMKAIQLIKNNFRPICCLTLMIIESLLNHSILHMYQSPEPFQSLKLILHHPTECLLLIMEVQRVEILDGQEPVRSLLWLPLKEKKVGHWKLSFWSLQFYWVCNCSLCSTKIIFSTLWDTLWLCLSLFKTSSINFTWESQFCGLFFPSHWTSFGLLFTLKYFFLINLELVEPLPRNPTFNSSNWLPQIQLFLSYLYHVGKSSCRHFDI